MPPMSRWSSLAALLAVLATASCVGGTNVSDEDTDRLRAAVERDVPGARVVDFKVNTGLGNCCWFELVARTEPGDPASARQLTRAVAKASWQNVPDGIDRFTVVNKVGGPDCAPTGTEKCWTDFITVPVAVAPWLWAAPGDPARRQPTSVSGIAEQSCPAGPDLDVPGFEWDRLEGFLPDLRAKTRIDFGLDDSRLLNGTQRIAQFVWRCYPAPLSTFTLDVQETVFVSQTLIQPTPTGLRNLEYRFTADELREQFGPRPGDLPQ